MWIQVRTFDGSRTTKVDNLSKLTKIEELRQKLVEYFDAPPETQRLFYRGKQLVDGHSLFDYDVGLNDIVQIMVRKTLTSHIESDCKNIVDEHEGKENIGPETCSDKSCGQKNAASTSEDIISANEPSQDTPTCTAPSGRTIFKAGENIDARDKTMNAWFEAKIVSVREATNAEKSGQKMVFDQSSRDLRSIQQRQYTHMDGIEPDGVIYKVTFEEYADDGEVELSCHDIRPRAKTKLNKNSIKVGEVVMVNYNYDEPKERGYWYDMQVTALRRGKSGEVTSVTGSLCVGEDAVLNGCKVQFLDELFAIEKNNGSLEECASSPGPSSQGEKAAADRPPAAPETPEERRASKPWCSHCKDVQSRKCKFCACGVCGERKDEDKAVMCDECDTPYHIYCLTPPLPAIPDVDEWYCPDCKNDDTVVVRAGERLKESKKKAKMPSASTQSSRDWGKGMACAGRKSVCSIVPPNHFGAIPGVPVGSSWKFRLGVSESGVHRPPVSGIAGRAAEGAYSVVLSGGYEDDQDFGDRFLYTGAGGRDLTGNKRTAEQSCDQKLTLTNLALARNCAASINAKEGAKAVDWKKGKPIRVVRNYKGAKHSEYAPAEGNRYDGLYKVVRYWPQKGKSGFMVWRYELYRDDPEPAPWTPEGAERIAKLGLTMMYPEGYEVGEEGQKTGKKKVQKRKKTADSTEDEDDQAPKPKEAQVAWQLDAETEQLVKLDEKNAKLWAECLAECPRGVRAFHAQVELSFACVCCQEVVYKPVTTPCSHNVCHTCLARSFKAEVYSCPYCRTELGRNFSLSAHLNAPLSDALVRIFPGYEAARA